MADKATKIEYAYVMVPDQPGRGAKLLSALKAARVNLVAYAGFPAGRGLAQLVFVPESMAALVRAVRRHGWKLSAKKHAFLVTGGDRVGAVSDWLARLADARISVTATHAVSARNRSYAMIIWVEPRDYEKAASALGAR